MIDTHESIRFGEEEVFRTREDAAAMRFVYNWHKWDWSSVVKPLSVLRLETARLIVCCSQIIWFCFLPLNLVSNVH